MEGTTMSFNRDAVKMLVRESMKRSGDLEALKHGALKLLGTMSGVTDAAKFLEAVEGFVLEELAGSLSDEEVEGLLVAVHPDWRRVLHTRA
jgi:hypothetical protein